MGDINTNSKITMMSDYIPKLMELYPNVSKKDIYKIIRSFQMNFISLIKKDVSIFINPKTAVKTEGYMILINGLGSYNSYRAINKWKALMVKKIRIKFNILDRKWNGYYYFALSDIQFAKLLSLKKKFAHTKKNYIFDNIILYKLFEECLTQQFGKKHIFRIPYIVDFGWSSWKKDFKCSDFEYIYRVENEGLVSINKNITRCDNDLFNNKEDLIWLKWVDKDLINKK